MPELHCSHMVLQPAAQLIMNNTQIHFNFNNFNKNDNLESLNCTYLCLFPYLRLIINNKTKTFKAREFCNNLHQIYFNNSCIYYFYNYFIFLFINLSFIVAKY